MLTCQLKGMNDNKWIQPSLGDKPGSKQRQSTATVLQVNEWCTADKMQIKMASEQWARSRKKPCSLLEAHHPPCPHSPNACHFFKKYQIKDWPRWRSHLPREGDVDLSKLLSNDTFWNQNQLQGCRQDGSFGSFTDSFQKMFLKCPKRIWLRTFLSVVWPLEYGLEL